MFSPSLLQECHSFEAKRGLKNFICSQPARCEPFREISRQGLPCKFGHENVMWTKGLLAKRQRGV
jgi:hypothetical protein